MSNNASHQQVVDTSYLYEQDPGHGWLRVSKAELIRLGIAGQISFYSYQKGDDVFLEEDLDMGIFILAKKAVGEQVDIVDKFVEFTAIRDYMCYTGGNWM